MNETETVVTVIWEMEYGGRSQVIQSQEHLYAEQKSFGGVDD